MRKRMRGMGSPERIATLNKGMSVRIRGSIWKDNQRTSGRGGSAAVIRIGPGQMKKRRNFRHLHGKPPAYRRGKSFEKKKFLDK